MDTLIFFDNRLYITALAAQSLQFQSSQINNLPLLLLLPVETILKTFLRQPAFFYSKIQNAFSLLFCNGLVVRLVVLGCFCYAKGGIGHSKFVLLKIFYFNILIYLFYSPLLHFLWPPG